jgi:hypothetical protein
MQLDDVLERHVEIRDSHQHLEVGAHDPPAQGVYQIGELYARSWIVVGTSSGSFTPSAFAS